MVEWLIGEAAAATGKSRSTLLRAIKSGRVSASRDDAGAFLLDPAEVARVFPLVSRGAASGANLARHDAASGEGDAAGEVLALRERLASAESRAAVAEGRAAVAEALADERAAALADARQSLADLRRLLPPPGRSWRWWPFR